MAASRIGGMSGAFIPVSEDANMIKSAELGHLSLAKLEALTCVCSVGLDMIAIPGDIPVSTLAAIIADEAALGMVNLKTTGVRIIPVPGKKAGEWAHFEGFLEALFFQLALFHLRVFSDEVALSRHLAKVLETKMKFPRLLDRYILVEIKKPLIFFILYFRQSLDY